MIKRIIALVITLLLTLSLSVFAFADFGDFGGDNDFGGGYDGGGYGGGSYDDGGYGGSYNDRDITEPSTTTYYSYKNYPSGNISDGKYLVLNANGEEVPESDNGDDDDDDGTSAVIGAIILGVILIIAAFSFKNNTDQNYYRRKKYSPSSAVVTTDVEAEKAQNLNSMSSYFERDPGFSDVEMREKLSNIYVKLQNAWQSKNLEEIRPYITDTLYGQYDRQLDAYRRNKQTNIIERIAVLSVDLSGWKQSGDNDLIVAEIRTRIVDYVINDTNNSLVRGSRTAEKFMTYEWTLSRKSGVKTINKDGTHAVNCPNCGAPVDINKSAKCEFCGSIITTDSSDWTINSIKAISQRTVGK